MSDPQPPDSGAPWTTGAVLRLPMAGGTSALAQIVAVEPQAVAVAVADVIWDCEPGVADWQASGRALVHLALRPAGLADAVVVGECPVDPSAVEAHTRWLESRAVTTAPLSAIVRALLSP